MNIKELKEILDKYDENLELSATHNYLIIIAPDKDDEEGTLYKMVGSIYLR